MIESWGWPQWFFVGVYAANILATSALHGKPRTGKNNGPFAIVSAAIGVWVLYKGGFWG